MSFRALYSDDRHISRWAYTANCCGGECWELLEELELERRSCGVSWRETCRRTRTPRRARRRSEPRPAPPRLQLALSSQGARKAKYQAKNSEKVWSMISSKMLLIILAPIILSVTSLPQDDEYDPSAPADPAPSAPVETFQSAECVVCLEKKVAVTQPLFQTTGKSRWNNHFLGTLAGFLFIVMGGNIVPKLQLAAHAPSNMLLLQCDIIFLPCGHLCSCSSCQQGLSSCPLCRANILQRVRL